MTDQMTSSPTDRADEPIEAHAEASMPIELVISKILRFGVLCSAALLLLGLALGVARGPLDGGGADAKNAMISPDATWPHTPGQLATALGDGETEAFILIGLLVLVGTQLIRVLASIGIYAKAKDWVYLSFTLIVLALLVTSFFVGATH